MQPRPGATTAQRPPAAAGHPAPARCDATGADPPPRRRRLPPGPPPAPRPVPPPPSPARRSPPRPPARRRRRAVGSDTGRPLPRFAALGSNQVNLRVGPDLRFRIDWTYQRKDLPVQIIEEHQAWRRIRDPEGTEGWVQKPLLSARRSFLVQGEERALRRKPEEAADLVARLRPGVIGSLRRCEAASAWCEARVGDYRGYIRRSEIWGVAPGEVIE